MNAFLSGCRSCDNGSVINADEVPCDHAAGTARSQPRPVCAIFDAGEPIEISRAQTFALDRGGTARPDIRHDVAATQDEMRALKASVASSFEELTGKIEKLAADNTRLHKEFAEAKAEWGSMFGAPNSLSHCKNFVESRLTAKHATAMVDSDSQEEVDYHKSHSPRMSQHLAMEMLRRETAEADIRPLYELKTTAWDALLLVQTGIMYPSDEFAVAFIGVINIVIQCLFIVIVQSDMTTGDFNDGDIVQQMKDWRVMYAHDSQYADAFNNVPLSKSVCTQNPLSMQGAQQSILFGNIDEYLHELGGVLSWTRAGPLLCMLALTLWLFTCAREIDRCYYFAVAVWCRVYDSGKQELQGCHRLWSAVSLVLHDKKKLLISGEIKVKTIDLDIGFTRAMILTCCVVIPRTIILAWLGIVGAQFLVATIELTELVLNAVALEVVLNVDELMYELFVPEAAKCLLEKTYPFRLQPFGGQFLMRRLVPWAKIAVFAVALVIIEISLLDPILTNLIDTRSMMCDGKTDFLAVATGLGPVVAGKPREPSEINRTSYTYRAVLQRTGLQAQSVPQVYLDSDRGRTPFPIRNVKEALRYQAFSMADFAGQTVGSSTFAQGCSIDVYWAALYPSTETAIWEAMKGTINDPHATSCAYLRSKSWCWANGVQNASAGRIVRFFCPATCGHNDTSSGIIFTRPDDGVPLDCDIAIGEDLENVPCEDLNVSKNQAAFHTYANGFEQLFGVAWARLAAGNATQDSIHRNLLREFVHTGCPWLQDTNNRSKWLHDLTLGVFYNLPFFLCTPEMLGLYGASWTARLICPQSCGCVSNVKPKYDQDGKNWTQAIGLHENCPKKCFS